MSADLIIGCPVWKREWVLKDWFRYANAAAERVEIIPEFAFVLDPDDEPILEIIKWAVDELDRNVHVLYVSEPEEMPEGRVWNEERYSRMAFLRNMLLSIATDEAPKLFLSLDSDILINEFALASMMEGMINFDAVGGKCFMSDPAPEGGLDGTEVPSWMNFVNGGVERHNHDKGIVPVDVIMAIKLMNPYAYSVNYQPHFMGEDIGWSLACAEVGLRLGWDGRVTNKHILIPNNLHILDERCGY